MKKTVLINFMLFFVSFSFSQSFMGEITKQVNFRNGPGTDYEIISVLKPDKQVFIVSIETNNDFYNIIDIETNKEGYVNKAFVKIIKEVKRSNESVFTPTGKSSNYNCDVKVFNNTSKTMSLKMNDDMFYFEPYETKNLDMNPENYDFRASAPGVIPYIGKEKLVSNQGYSWEFYIVTKRR